MTLAAELAAPILFVEARFLWIFAIIFAVHWAIRNATARKVWLLVSSHCFYGCFFIGDPLVFFPNLFAGKWEALPVGWWFPSLLWGSTFLDYFVGIGIEDAKTDRKKKAWVLASLTVNLGVLAFFKYYGFFEANVRAVFEWLHLTPSWEPLNIFLPYGISFYTFQSLSYSLEVYRKHLPAERNFLNLAFFVAWFPQVVAGPIVRAMSFLPQTREPRRWANVDVRGNLTMFFMGFVKKACIADTLATVSDMYFSAPQEYTPYSAWIALLAYAGQIYCDFSGYSDMAIAVSRLLGYDLVQNFNFPYFSKNIGDFWRRWHMSLSSWLRDYLYISLGGNRGGKWFIYRNLMLTMLLGGLWHGASWAFLLWGGLHGLALIVHREWSARFGKKKEEGAAPARGFSAWAVFASVLTFLWVILAWVPFRAGDTYVGYVSRGADEERLIPHNPGEAPAAKDGAPKSQLRALRMVGGSFHVNGKEEALANGGGLKRDTHTGHFKDKEGNILVARAGDSWHTTGMTLGALFGKSPGPDAKRGVAGNAFWIILGVIGVIHWMNSRRYLSMWWRRIPDWSFAFLLGIGWSIAIFFKPIAHAAFIYFQF